jgi:inosose dehydratase
VIVVANAPVSYGAFELTVGIDPNVPDGTQILDEVAAAGYAGIDLGPVGYLGSGDELAERLASRNLGLCGAYLEMPYSDPAAMPAVMPQLDAMLDIFDAVRGRVPGPPPRPTLADASSDARRARPGQGHLHRGIGLADDSWVEFGQGLEMAVARCRERGYEPTFHNETGTYVEAPWEIQRMLDVSDIGLCLDTGHLLIGGGDPVTALRSWADRINHVHLKDARRAVLDQITADRAPTTEIWEREVFPPLGTGDLDVDGVLAQLREMNYEGWLVVEQDSFPRTKERFDRAASDQRANREYLRQRGL